MPALMRATDSAIPGGTLSRSVTVDTPLDATTSPSQPAIESECWTCDKNSLSARSVGSPRCVAMYTANTERMQTQRTMNKVSIMLCFDREGGATDAGVDEFVGVLMCGE